MNSNIINYSSEAINMIKEIQNSAMTDVAAAVSSMLNANISISGKGTNICKVSEIDCSEYGTSAFVKIAYKNGISGNSLIVFRKDDIQLMVSRLMGMPAGDPSSFVLDEINKSAFEGIINQFTFAMSSKISSTLNISVEISDEGMYCTENEKNMPALLNISPDTAVFSISYDMKIDQATDGKILMIMTPEITNNLLGSSPEISEEDIFKKSSPEPPKNSPENINPNPVNDPPPIVNPNPVNDPPPIINYPPQSPIPSSPISVSPDMQQALFQNSLSQEQLNNLQLLMNVPLELSIEIGSTEKKVDEILSFSNGTVVELDCPSDTPVNVIVNGHLIARGDVVVVDDHFAVRVTEIIKSNLIETLRNPY